MNITNKDIEQKVNDLDKKVGSLAQRQDEILIPGMVDIKKQLQDLSFVTQKEYSNDMNGENGLFPRVKNLEKYLGILEFLDKLKTRINGYVILVLAVGIIGFVAFNISGVLPAIFGGK